MSRLSSVREFSQGFLDKFGVGGVCLFWGGVKTEIYCAPVDRATGLPLPTFLPPADALKSRGVVFLFPAIGEILGIRSWPEIGSAIVERILIFVVNVVRFALQNLAMHLDHFLAQLSLGIEVLRFRVQMGTPVPLGQRVIVRRINYGVPALRERNKSVGWIERLDNSVSFHVAFHSLTLNEIVRQFSRNAIIALPAASEIREWLATKDWNGVLWRVGAVIAKLDELEK